MKITDEAKEALQELMARNPLRNDFDAYQLALAKWGLGISDERPWPEEFGQPALSNPTTPGSLASIEEFKGGD